MIEEDAKNWLASQGVAGPFSFDFFSPDNSLRVLIKVDGGPPSDQHRQWEYPLLTVLVRDPSRVAARATAFQVYHLLNAVGPISMGNTKVAWSMATGRPSPLGRSALNLFSWRIDFELHTHYNTTN